MHAEKVKLLSKCGNGWRQIFEIAKLSGQTVIRLSQPIREKLRGTCDFFKISSEFCKSVFKSSECKMN